MLRRGSEDSLILEWNEDVEQDREPKTMWVRDWHDASTYGTNLLDKIIPKRGFAFPKSLYAVQDTLMDTLIVYLCDEVQAYGEVMDMFDKNLTGIYGL